MKKTKILFVCKHNKFRSLVAEAYFKKINKNKSIIVSSAGLIRGDLPLEKKTAEAMKEFGLDVKRKPEGLSIDLIRKQNLIIIVADDVPKNTFDRKEYINFKTTKIIVWEIPDNPGATSIIKIRKIIKAVMKKVEQLNEELERKNQNDRTS